VRGGGEEFLVPKMFKSKRTWLFAVSFLVLVLAAAAVAVDAAFAPAQINSVGPRPPRSYFDAIEIAKWLDGAAIKTPAGLAWPSDPRDPKTVNSSLYAGTPGVILFYLEADAAAKDFAPRYSYTGAYAVQAKNGADELIARIADEPGTGLYEGLGGVGFALEETYKATHEAKYRKGFLDCLGAIAAKARPKGKGVEWGAVTDIISGGAGTGLVLLYAFKETGDRRWLDLAAKAGDRLLELGKPKNGGLDWAMDPSNPRIYPNFSHGTAGVAFFLARLHEATGKKPYLDASLAGAKYLLSIAKTDGDACLIYHDEPDGKNLYYLGWCHGPVGTANLIYALFKITGDKSWMDWVEKSARGLMESGIPEKETPGFWNNDGICCGLAGVADFFRALYRQSKNEEHIWFSQRAVDMLRKKATADAAGMRWVQAEHRVRPDLLIAQTGLMQGAAGIGIVMLRFAAEAGPVGLRPVRIVLPDSAF
jgi:lantibiotic modifying enzyme